MAHIVRITNDHAYVTIRLPVRLWRAYENEFPTWPQAVTTLRDHLLITLATKTLGSFRPTSADPPDYVRDLVEAIDR